MKSLLRSVFLVQATESEKEANNNFSYLLSSSFTFDLPEDQEIWNFIKTFYKAQGHVPQVASIRSHFERGRNPSVVDRLEQSILSEKPKVKGDFLSHLQNVIEDKRCLEIASLTKQMMSIIRTGLEIQEGREKVKLHGSGDAVRYFLNKGSSLLAPVSGGRLSGNVMKDGDLFKKRYEKIETDPKAGVGHYCGIKQIDDAFRGAQKKKLWVHLAWPGHLKSSFALHWAYVQAVYFGFPSLYFSLEMPYEEQVLNYFYVMHSAHEDFAEVRESLGIEGLGLNYDKIKYAELNRKEKEFLFKFVVPDLNREATVDHSGPFSLEAKDYGDLLIDCYDTEKSTFTVDDVRSKVEILHQQIPLSLVYVDNITNMDSIRKFANTTDKYNEIVRGLKKLAVTFNHGEGLAIVALMHTSRQGYDHALRNNGIYTMLAANYANEIEKSADVLTASWFGEEVRKINRALIQNLKARDEKSFDRFAIRVEPSCRRMLTDQTSMQDVEHEIQVALGETEDINNGTAAAQYRGGQPNIDI
jgi:hypothetical protein